MIVIFTPESKLRLAIGEYEKAISDRFILKIMQLRYNFKFVARKLENIMKYSVIK